MAKSKLGEFVSAAGNVAQRTVETAIPLAMAVEFGPSGIAGGQQINDMLFRPEQRSRLQDLNMRERELRLNAAQSKHEEFTRLQKENRLDQMISDARGNSLRQMHGFLRDFATDRDALDLMTDDTVKRIQGLPGNHNLITIDAMAELLFRERRGDEGAGEALDRLAAREGIVFENGRQRLRTLDGEHDLEVNPETFGKLRDDALRFAADEAVAEIREKIAQHDGAGLGVNSFVDQAMAQNTHSSKKDAQDDAIRILKKFDPKGPEINEFSLINEALEMLRREKSGTNNSERGQQLMKRLIERSKKSGLYNLIVFRNEFSDKPLHDGLVSYQLEPDENGIRQDVQMSVEGYIDMLARDNPVFNAFDSRLKSIKEGQQARAQSELAAIEAEAIIKESVKPKKDQTPTEWYQGLSDAQARAGFELIKKSDPELEGVTFEQWERDEGGSRSERIDKLYRLRNQIGTDSDYMNFRKQNLGF